jgi:RimJ/RimL family protein N-acetyltransferase
MRDPQSRGQRAEAARLGRSYGDMCALHLAVAAPLTSVVTRRLALDPLGSDDLDELAAMFAQPETWYFEYGRGLTRGETEAFLDRQLKLWDECGFGGCGVRDRPRLDLIGIVGLGVPMLLQELLPPVTVGWRFSPAKWGTGYATEASAALLDQAFTVMGVDRVGCVTNAQNRRSIGVAERLGMSVITEASVPSDEGTRTVSVLLLEVARSDWFAIRDS